MDFAFALGAIGLGGAGACIGAYLWGYIYKVEGFRPLNVLALFATVVAMAQLGLMLTDRGGPANAVYAMAFMLISGLAQGLSAVKTRPPRTGMHTRASDGLV